jgi:uncharacterized protein (UPF0548 family)
VFFLRKPNQATVEQLLAEHATDSVSYLSVGATQRDAPAGYNIDRHRVFLGQGLKVFQAAKAAIKDWKMFDMRWIEVLPMRPSVKVANSVAILVRHLGFWSVNISRIVYVVDEPSRYGFAYGTLACHSEEGEERFLVEHDPTTEEVWYHLSAFSRPRHPLARIGFPIARRLQKRFARESLAAMKRACHSPGDSD